MKGIGRVLVPLSGEVVDGEALRLAFEIAKRSKAEVHGIHVIEVKRSLPLDAGLERETRKGEDLLHHAEEVADELSYEITTDLLQAREAGPAIVEEAAEREVDAIVMGMSYKKRFGQFNLSHVILYVLRNAPCRVILCREPIPSSPNPKEPEVIERTRQSL